MFILFLRDLIDNRLTFKVYLIAVSRTSILPYGHYNGLIKKVRAFFDWSFNWKSTFEREENKKKVLDGYYESLRVIMSPQTC